MDDISAADVVETVRDGLLVLDADLSVVSSNRAFHTMFQTSPEATLGRQLYELGDGQWDIPALRELLENIIPQASTVDNYEVEHNFPGVGVKIMLLNARKIFRVGNNIEFLLLAIEDVTAITLKEREAELNWRLAQNVVDTVRDPMIILESDFTVVTANRSFLNIFGINAGALIGQHLESLGHGQWDVSALLEQLRRVVPDDKPMNDFLLEDDFPGIGRRVFKINARKVFVVGNHVTRLLVVFEDATEATRENRHRDILAAELAHRVKNNLQIISSFVSYEMRHAAEPCLDGYRAMQTRINAVAQLYDVIAKANALGPVPMTDYLSGIAASIRSSLPGDDTSIRVTVDAEPLSLQSDLAVPVGLIVNELATNAIKYAFPDGNGEITLGFRHRDGEIVLSVSDDGVGLDSDGTAGLGSRFIAAFVQQIGGTLAAAGGQGGTTISVRLPMTVIVSGIKAAS